jgi:hypothetical protein
MLGHLIVAVSLAGTYAAEGTLEPIEVTVGSTTESCFPLAPGATFRLEGPAAAQLFVWVDLPKRPRKPRPVRLHVEVAGKTLRKRLKPRRARRSVYAPAKSPRPSRRLRAAALDVPDGAHLLSVVLPPDRTGCVSIAGLERANPPGPDELSVAPSLPVEPVEPGATSPPSPGAVEPDPEPAAVAATDAPALQPAKPEATAPETDPDGAPELAPLPGTTVATVHEISATEIGGAPAIEAEVPVTDAAEGEGGDLLRVGVGIGGVLPRADLKPGYSVSLLIDLPLRSIGVPASFEVAGVSAGLSVYAEGGWSPMRQQETTIIPGRGQTNLIQSSLVLPFDLGIRLRLALGGLAPFLGVGFAADYTRTELRAFSTEPVQQNDLALGVAVGGGLAIRLGPGDLMLELGYRETNADLGSYDDIAEDTLANGVLQLGYVLALGR